MEGDTKSWTLLITGAVFLGYLLVKLRVSLVPVSPEARAARLRIAEVKKRARSPELSPQQRADAWREAAMLALEGLERPSLAASYARRAERVYPEDDTTVSLVARALRAAGRLRALERLLWRQLARTPQGSVYGRALDELIALYDGPMRRPDRASVLRRLRRGPVPPR